MDHHQRLEVTAIADSRIGRAGGLVLGFAFVLVMAFLAGVALGVVLGRVRVAHQQEAGSAGAAS